MSAQLLRTGRLGGEGSLVFVPCTPIVRESGARLQGHSKGSKPWAPFPGSPTPAPPAPAHTRSLCSMAYLCASIAVGMDHVLRPLLHLQLDGQLLLQPGHTAQVGDRAGGASRPGGQGGIWGQKGKSSVIRARATGPSPCPSQILHEGCAVLSVLYLEYPSPTVRIPGHTPGSLPMRPVRPSPPVPAAGSGSTTWACSS